MHKFCNVLVLHSNREILQWRDKTNETKQEVLKQDLMAMAKNSEFYTGLRRFNVYSIL